LYLVNLNENKQVVTLQVDLVVWSYQGCDGADHVVSQKHLVVADRWAYRKLYYDALARIFARHDCIISSRECAHLLPRLICAMEMWSKNLFRNSLETLGGGLIGCRNWRQSLYVAQVSRLSAICNILADLVDKGDRLKR